MKNWCVALRSPLRLRQLGFLQQHKPSLACYAQALRKCGSLSLPPTAVSGTRLHFSLYNKGESILCVELLDMWAKKKPKKF